MNEEKGGLSWVVLESLRWILLGDQVASCTKLNFDGASKENLGPASVGLL